MKIMKKFKLIISILIVIIAILLLIYMYVKNNPFLRAEQNLTAGGKVTLDPKVRIINVESNSRTIALMVDNERDAWPQAGLQEAYMIYEIIVEGGQTRMLALFKDAETTMIGPIRSARHYFLDYAMENDVIFTHFGFSPQAISDIKTYSIANISGTQADGSAFWREKPLGSYHNVFTSIEKIKTRATKKKYRLTTDQAVLLTYSIPILKLSEYEKAKVAEDIYIKYSASHNVSYKYDADKKVYLRSMRGIAHVDRKTKEQYRFKNIIVYQVQNYSLNDGSGKNRQGLYNIGSGTGYYISEGYAVPITWSKASRRAKTVYKDLAGNILKVNDGNTFIQIQPKGQTLTIK